MLRCSRSLLAALPLLTTLSAAQAVDFSSQIQPLFAEHCLECHGPDQAKGGLNLTGQTTASKVLKSGELAIVPGKPEQSALIQRLLTHDLDDRMPPKDKKPLKPKEIETLKAWIAAGAKWDTHWAYKPLQTAKAKASLPQSIDHHIKTKLVQHQLAPSPEAESATLIKRAYYDLLGLPPTPQQVDAFAASYAADPAKAWPALIDELLASPHFGERWGRHWLDAARYADSDGYEKDKPRPDAWRYRDWVINAINADMPFDQFTIEQIAGDLLPNATDEQIVATAFHRQTLTNTEGGTDQEQFRNEAVMDRVETIGTVWLGLTVGCARCHSHKYDQISHREYYQLFAFFNNADEVNRKVPESQEKWAAYLKAHGQAAAALAPLQKAVDAAKAAIPVNLPAWEKDVQARLAAARASKATQTFLPLKPAQVSSLGKVVFKAQADGSHLATGPSPASDTYTLEVPLGSEPITALRLEVMTDATLPAQGPGRHKNGNFVLSEVTASLGGDKIKASPVLLHSAVADFTQKDFKPEQTIDGEATGLGGWAIGGATSKPHSLTLQLAEPIEPAKSKGQRLFITLAQNYGKKGQEGHTLGRFRLLAASQVTEASIAPEAVVRLLGEPPVRRNPGLIPPLYDWLEKIDPAYRQATAALAAAKAKLPPAPNMDVRVIGQRTANIRQTKLLHRGDFLQPTEPVEPSSLAVLPPVSPTTENGKRVTENATRLDFARWLVSKDNPLTPRVTANAIWSRLFGEGLARTVSDFGVRGEKPSHPELLDELAQRFIELGWRRKALIKEIMLSSSYRQTSAPAASPVADKTATLDPLNTLLWRQNRFRVEGEVVRDIYLAASGLLSPKIGGPSVFPPMPPDIAALSYANNFKWANSSGEDRYRRGMYTFFKRTAPHPDLTTFDCPDANLTNVKRTLSNTPLQALTTLNAEAFNEAAQALARRVLSEPSPGAGDSARLAHCLRLCIGRQPSLDEIKALADLLAESHRYYQAHSDEAKALIGSYTSKAPAPAEQAAWIATARIALNLDECLTRE